MDLPQVATATVATKEQCHIAEDMIRHDDLESIVGCADPLYGPTPGYMNSLVDAAEQGKTVVHFIDQFSGGDLHPMVGVEDGHTTLA